MSEINVGDLNVSNELRLPVYNSANRPVNPSTGFMIFNSTEEKMQIWDGSNWKSFGQKNYDISATGNYQSIDLTNEYNGYRCYKFTGDGTITVNQSNPDSGVEFVLIAGGGGGGGVIGGGGGGGGVIYRRSVYLAPGTYSITIGQGGAAGTGWNSPQQEGSAGGPSIFTDNAGFTYEAVGGGGGCAHGGSSPNRIAGQGGSGGGSANVQRRGGNAIGKNFGPQNTDKGHDIRSVYSSNNEAHASTDVLGRSGQSWDAIETSTNEVRGVQGNAGGIWGDGDAGAGGGGCGSNGGNGGAPRDTGGEGGHGCYFDLDGNMTGYAGGGGGGVRGTGRRRGVKAGDYGGGDGGRSTSAPVSFGSPTSNNAEAGGTNRGGGGGGGGYNAPRSGAVGGPGGSGIFMIRYKRT